MTLVIVDRSHYKRDMLHSIIALLYLFYIRHLTVPCIDFYHRLTMGIVRIIGDGVASSAASFFKKEAGGGKIKIGVSSERTPEKRRLNKPV